MTQQTSWDLSPLFSSLDDSALQQEQEELVKQNRTFAKKWTENPKYLSDPEVLKTALDEYEKLERSLGTSGMQGYYYWLSSELDQLSPELKARLNKITELSSKLANERRFFLLNLSKVSADQQAVFLSATGLAPYHYFLQRLFTVSKYELSEKEENILSLLGLPAYGSWVRMTEAFLAEEERVVLDSNKKKKRVPFGELMSLTTDNNKEVRDVAAAEVHAITAQYAPIAEQEFNAILQTKKVEDELRGFDRPDSSRHLSDDIDTAVVDAMLSAVEGQYQIARDFYQLKAKLLGLKQLAYHERNVEYGEIKQEYSYEDSITLVEKVLSKLDPEFGAITTRLSQSGQIDVFPKKGKANGAFCAHELLDAPTYVLLNHTNKLRDVTTLAHELGHAINNELMRPKQHALYFGTPLSTAEVASTFMEDFVLEELVHGADEEQRLAIMLMKLNDDISSIFRQVAAYRFEQELHKTFRERGYLPKEEIGQIFSRHMSSYMGPAVEQSEGSQNWWVYWSHFRRFFYVYSYASGLLISKSLQAKVRKDPKFIKKVKEFLSAGLSSSPREVFEKLGVDITDTEFWNIGIGEIRDLLEEATALAKKLGKI